MVKMNLAIILIMMRYRKDCVACPQFQHTSCKTQSADCDGSMIVNSVIVTLFRLYLLAVHGFQLLDFPSALLIWNESMILSSTQLLRA